MAAMQWILVHVQVPLQPLPHQALKASTIQGQVLGPMVEYQSSVGHQFPPRAILKQEASAYRVLRKLNPWSPAKETAPFMGKAWQACILQLLPQVQSLRMGSWHIKHILPIMPSSNTRQVWYLDEENHLVRPLLGEKRGTLAQWAGRLECRLSGHARKSKTCLLEDNPHLWVHR